MAFLLTVLFKLIDNAVVRDKLLTQPVAIKKNFVSVAGIK